MRARLTYANVMATIAMFLALGGTTYAATKIGTKQLRNRAVTNAKLAPNSVTSAKVKDRSLLAKDFKIGQLPRGPRGPQGVPGPRGPRGPAGGLTGTAGGDLTGRYPNPQLRANSVGAAEIAANAVGASEIAANAVGASEIATGAVGAAEIAGNAVGTGHIIASAIGSAEVANGSLRLVDIAVARGTVEVDPPSLGAGECVQHAIAIAAAAAGDMVLLAPPATLDPALHVSQPRLAEAGSVRVGICAMGSAVDAPPAAWTYAVLR